MCIRDRYKEGMMDQVDRVIYDLKHTPFSRRILTNIYEHQDLHEMNLYPCAYSMTFNVTQKKDVYKRQVTGSPREVLRESFKAKLISDDAWMDMLKVRNELAHDYDCEVVRLSLIHI